MTNLIAAAAFLASLIIVTLIMMVYPARAGWPESEWSKPAVQQPAKRHIHRTLK